MKLFLTAIFILAGATLGWAQVASGGSYTLDKSVIASGGGTSSGAGGSLYTLNGTIGQAAVSAPLAGGSYSLQSGFQTPAPAAPTAGSVTISGRAMTADGRGIRNVRVELTDAQGETRVATTSAFGYYRFADVEAGETVILTARGKRFFFAQPAQVVNASEDQTEINFVAY